MIISPTQKKMTKECFFLDSAVFNDEDNGSGMWRKSGRIEKGIWSHSSFQTKARLISWLASSGPEKPGQAPVFLPKRSTLVVSDGALAIPALVMFGARAASYGFHYLLCSVEKMFSGSAAFSICSPRWRQTERRGAGPGPNANCACVCLCVPGSAISPLCCGATANRRCSFTHQCLCSWRRHYKWPRESLFKKETNKREGLGNRQRDWWTRRFLTSP